MSSSTRIHFGIRQETLCTVNEIREDMLSAFTYKRKLSSYKIILFSILPTVLIQFRRNMYQSSTSIRSYVFPRHSQFNSNSGQGPKLTLAIKAHQVRATNQHIRINGKNSLELEPSIFKKVIRKLHGTLRKTHAECNVWAQINHTKATLYEKARKGNHLETAESEGEMKYQHMPQQNVGKCFLDLKRTIQIVRLKISQ